ncbi:hypothetical protein AB833_08925 [Chromatiales bacterium (ex Bugula neritina AB1)]|nr:hypothetical protein AB833_08925 [Chromatiales bacterium (ex Bugula neritina AB1)]
MIRINRVSSLAIRCAAVFIIALVALAGWVYAASDDSAGAVPVPDSIWANEPGVRRVLAPATSFTRAEKYELMQGGAGSSKNAVDQNSFSHETQTLDFESLQRFKIGNALFNKFWVSSPSSTLASDGLGPLFSARACQSCHIKDGRGQRPVGTEKTASLVIQLKRLVDGEWVGDPVYGSQLQTSAVPGVAAEALVRIENRSHQIKFANSTLYKLHAPEYIVEDLAYGELHEDTVLSPRIAPAMPGLGLIEAIAAEDILAYADPQDADNNGISGRANWQVLSNGEKRLGRFGHKAAMSSLDQQNSNAFLIDMGLSTDSLGNPDGDCTEKQLVCKGLPNGVQPHLGESEVPGNIMRWLNFYTSHLAVPVRRDVSDPAVLAGKELFYRSGCISCHVPKHVTDKEALLTAHRFQLIWPYSDFLLHDMGEALSDGAGEGAAAPREWRTAPLWGIGLAKTVNPGTSFLHDGRANSLLEAVLWHGGEAAPSRDKVLAMKD